jgi:hypothetical protein
MQAAPCKPGGPDRGTAQSGSISWRRVWGLNRMGATGWFGQCSSWWFIPRSAARGAAAPLSGAGSVGRCAWCEVGLVGDITACRRVRLVGLVVVGAVVSVGSLAASLGYIV